MTTTAKLLLAAALASGAAGCAKKAQYVDPDAESRVEGTGMESRDIRAIAAQMSSELVASPALAGAAAPPRIAVLPVENRSRFLIDAEILTTLITDELISNSAGKLGIVNRDLIDQIQRERAMKARGEVSDNGQIQALAGVDWFLEGSVESLSASTSNAQTDYVVVRFQLTNAETSIVAWSNRYEMKKEGSWGVMYQ
ncbi:MAG: CsgG/HfaB family protein [Myxococcota bacterium]